MTRLLGVLVAVASVPLLASPSGAVFLAGCALLVAGTTLFARPVPPRDGEGGAPVRRRATPTSSGSPAAGVPHRPPAGDPEQPVHRSGGSGPAGDRRPSGRRVLRVLWGADAPGEANVRRLLELAVAVVLMVNVTAAWMAPEPVSEPVVFLCGKRETHCQSMAREARLEAQP